MNYWSNYWQNIFKYSITAFQHAEIQMIRACWRAGNASWQGLVDRALVRCIRGARQLMEAHRSLCDLARMIQDATCENFSLKKTIDCEDVMSKTSMSCVAEIHIVTESGLTGAELPSCSCSSATSCLSSPHLVPLCLIPRSTILVWFSVSNWPLSVS